MSYLLKIEKGGTAETLPPLTAAEALQLWNDAEARGLTAHCTDEAGNPVSKENLHDVVDRV